MNRYFLFRYPSNLISGLKKHFAVQLQSQFYASTATRRRQEQDHFYLQSLNIKDQFRPVKKQESFVKRSFFGELDKDYLDFPNYVYSENEAFLLNQQYQFIRRNFLRICADKDSLVNCGFFDVNTFSSFELVHLFESIGASLNYKSSFDNEISTTQLSSSPSSNKLVPIENKLFVTESFMKIYQQEKSFVQSILPLLVHNSLALGAISGASNSTIKDKLSLEDSLATPDIAFAFCELNEKLTALPYSFWDSVASYNPEQDTWLVSGSKSRIIKSDYNKFVIFCKTPKDPNCNVKNATDFGIASFLVDQTSVQIESDGTDNYGNQYMKISFKDLTLPRREHELFNSEAFTVNGPNFALNIKAKGQMAASAIIFGMMKEAVGNLVKAYKTGQYLCNESLLSDRIFHLNKMLYSLESMLYLTASHLDSFHLDHIDLYLQALVVKTLATEFATEMLNIFRFLLQPHQLTPIMSTQTVDVLNVLDAFLDSATSNRMLLATHGMQHIGSWKYDHIAKMRLNRIYFNHFLKFVTIPSFKRKVLQRSSSSMDEFQSMDRLMPSLKESANLLKQSLSEIMSNGDLILDVHGKEVVHNQIDMNRFASSVMGAFQMVSVISRANDSLQKKAPNSSHELILCQAICRQEAKKVAINSDLIVGILDTSEEKRSRTIHKRNMRFEGYFAKPTFDRVI